MKQYIPNTLTCCNLIAGCIATYLAFNGAFSEAMLAVVTGAVFDFFDGMSARLLGVSSPIGKELDSLADNITFGLAPSAVAFTMMTTACGGVRFGLALLTFVMAAFSALRLAKFNLDERQTSSFIGLPTPANALYWTSLACFSQTEWLLQQPWAQWALLLGIAVSCWLLVAEIPMFALKFKHWGWNGNEVRYLYLLTAALLIVGCAAVGFGTIGIALAIAWYVLLSVATSKQQK